MTPIRPQQSLQTSHRTPAPPHLSPSAPLSTQHSPYTTPLQSTGSTPSPSPPLPTPRPRPSPNPNHSCPPLALTSTPSHSATPPIPTILRPTAAKTTPSAGSPMPTPSAKATRNSSVKATQFGPMKRRTFLPVLFGRSGRQSNASQVVWML